MTAARGKTTHSVRNSLAGLDVKSHGSETLESSLGTDYTVREFIEGPDEMVRVRGPSGPEIDTALVEAKLSASRRQQIPKDSMFAAR